MANKILEQFSKYERARIVGARGLQISMDAPLLLNMKSEAMENLNFDPLRLAEQELDSGILPISIKRPMPKRKDEKLQPVRFDTGLADETKEKLEAKEEKDIIENGEIMELATENDDDVEDIIESDGNDDAGGDE